MKVTEKKRPSIYPDSARNIMWDELAVEYDGRTPARYL